MSKAVVIAHWPGKDVPACAAHMAKLTAVASAMGFALSFTPCDPETETECTNCENENRFKGEEAEKILPSQY